MEIHQLNTRASIGASDYFAVDNGSDTAKYAYSDLSAAVRGDITGAATTVLNNNLTASRVVVSNGSGKIGVSSITTTILNRLSGLTENVQSALNGKAPLDSPGLTGTPTAPTAAAGTNTPQIATTAFVQAGLSAIAPTYSIITANKPTAASNRVGTILGGYGVFGGVVYYAIRCTAAIDMGTSDFWTILEGFPVPPIEQAVAAAVIGRTGGAQAYITTAGKLIVSTTAGIATGNNITVCGVYFVA